MTPRMRSILHMNGGAHLARRRLETSARTPAEGSCEDEEEELVMPSSLARRVGCLEACVKPGTMSWAVEAEDESQGEGLVWFGPKEEHWKSYESMKRFDLSREHQR